MGRVPKGMATHLPDGASKRRYAAEAILSVFFRWGYREVVTPIFEYLDVLAAGLNEDLLRKSYKFVDRESGRLMILRPDMTPQVARMVAGNLFENLRPLRLCYHGNVFRYEEPHAGRERETFQVGGELVGPDSPRADAEVISIAVECLQSLGLERFRISLGHAGFLKGILKGLPPGAEERVVSAISRRDITRLESMTRIDAVLRPFAAILPKIPDLFGGEEVFGEAESLVATLPSSEPRRALEDLREVYSSLSLQGYREYILVDLGEVLDRDYYTGVFFEMFTGEIGYPVGHGGRYNQLAARFGKKCPSTGFALDVEILIRAMESAGTFPEKKGIDFLVADYSPDGAEGVRFSGLLRRKGFQVSLEVMGRDMDEALRYAQEVCISEVLLFGLPESRKGEFLRLEVPTGRKSAWTQETFLKQLSEQDLSIVPSKGHP